MTGRLVLSAFKESANLPHKAVELIMLHPMTRVIKPNGAGIVKVFRRVTRLVTTKLTFAAAD